MVRFHACLIGCLQAGRILFCNSKFFFADTLYITTSSSLPSEDWLIYDSDIEEDIATPLMTTSAGIVMILVSFAV